jgi:hypothetical protein
MWTYQFTKGTQKEYKYKTLEETFFWAAGHFKLFLTDWEGDEELYVPDLYIRYDGKIVITIKGMELIKLYRDGEVFPYDVENTSDELNAMVNMMVHVDNL